MTFDRYNFLKAIYLDTSDRIAVIKSTQCGISEWLWLYTVGAAVSGFNVFYVLPTIILKNQFVRDRIDRSITFTPYYRKLIKEGDRNSESMSLKHIGRGGVAFIGSNSAASFTSYAADISIIDELDRCDQKNLAMTAERLSNSSHRKEILVSNPTIENFGIDESFSSSDRKEWHIKCGCGNWVKPDFFRDVVRKEGSDWIIQDEEWYTGSDKDIRLICPACGKPYDRFGEGEWVSEAEGKISGYHISKLFSTKTTIAELLERFESGLVNDDRMQRFYNGDLGVAFTAEGAKISVSMLNECKREYRMEDVVSGPCVMGVDVGSKLHVRISRVLDTGELQAVYIGTADTYTDIRDLYYKFKVRVGVIDANPERRLSAKIKSSLAGFWMCFYGQTKREVVDANSKIITVPRTPALDAVKEHVSLQTILLPMNAQSIEDYYVHMVASTRVYVDERDEYVWREGSKPDHYFHAEAYQLLAKKLLIAMVKRK